MVCELFPLNLNSLSFTRISCPSCMPSSMWFNFSADCLLTKASPLPHRISVLIDSSSYCILCASLLYFSRNSSITFLGVLHKNLAGLLIALICFHKSDLEIVVIFSVENNCRFLYVCFKSN